jgi:type IV pilus assembly protein PilM
MPSLRRTSNSRRTLVGLDIEPGAVHAAQVAVNGKITVQRAASAPLEPGVVRDGEVVDTEALSRVLREMFAEHKLDKRVRLGVANQRVVVRVLELPPILDPKELEVAVRFQAADQVPMPLDQAVLEHIQLDTVNTPEGPRMRVLIVAARRDMIEKLLKAVQDAGLRPEGVDLSAFAMIRALGAQSDAPVLHLAVGGVVNLAVAQNGQCVFTRVVGGGLEAMAIELAERREISVEEARADLHRIGLSLEPAPVVSEPAEPVVEPALDRRATDEPKIDIAVPADQDDIAVPAGQDDIPVPADQDLIELAQMAAASPAPAPPAAPAAPARPRGLSSKEDPDVTQTRIVLTDGVRRIASEVRNSVDFHLGADQAVERVVLTGAAAVVPGLPEALSESLGLPVEVAQLDTPRGVSAGAFAVAAGLAIEEAVS